ncbi:hypothetical protein D3C71_664870 [compost metagenome]
MADCSSARPIRLKTSTKMKAAIDSASASSCASSAGLAGALPTLAATWRSTPATVLRYCSVAVA